MEKTKILSDLYNGKIRPIELTASEDTLYKDVLAEVLRLEQELTKQFTDEQKKLFEDYMTANGKHQTLRCEQHFVNGCRIGGELIAAILYKDDEKG